MPSRAGKTIDNPGAASYPPNVSGVIGHTAYAILAARAAEERKLPVAPVIRGHYDSYLSGAYLGCDIQTVPSAICLDTGEPVGHGPVPVERSPLTGGAVRPWTLSFEGREITPREIHDTFYGRAHLILGWAEKDRGETIGWSEFLDFAADVAGDALELFGPGTRGLAWVLGWFTHVVGDGLIKSVLQGLNLHLLDGKYTATNRPVQDLMTFNEIGKKELGLDWSNLLNRIAAAPVEEVQLHYMRCGRRQGRLGAHFPKAWAPDLEPLLRAILAENHRYQQIRNRRLVEELSLSTGPDGAPVCNAALSKTAGGLSYTEMLAASREARFREALAETGELIADAFEGLVQRQDGLRNLAAP
ncbi:MAG: hypothetical protein KDN18_25030 [Verrucomicrobiae bacterium]|nr:hypothetical protein [Verrucomicrobiae bacterium]